MKTAQLTIYRFPQLTLKPLISFYTYLVNLGIDPEQKREHRNKKLLNILCITWYHVSVIFIAIYGLVSSQLWHPIALQSATTLLIFSFVQYLNVKDYAELSKFLFFGFSIVQCTLVGIFTIPGELTELFLIVYPLAAVVLYQRFTAHFIVLLVSLTAALSSHIFFQDYDLPNTVLVVITVAFFTPYLIVLYIKQFN
ncbi:hypothetical protein [Tunicatimonas pelagia]|uniref:hypothetical protein n=1 Tax=Tunicatimonas pelagia TaxID=931531 RepID=UPI0026651B36|nr:hypothetical protein [Tunicatimonas pelagia]WKN45805.1 hypothetical protein P0M28_12635 [Tunicatimonas pelagia]